MNVFDGNNIVLKDFLKTFEEATGLTVCLYDFKERSKGSRALSVDGSTFLHRCAYCAFVKSTGKSYALCFANDHDGLAGAIKTGKSYVKKCHAGLDEIVVPVLSGGKYLGCILAGQAFFSKPSAKAARKITRHLEDLGLNGRKARSLMEKVRVIPKKDLKSASLMLKLLVNFIIEAESKQAWERELKGIKNGIPSGRGKFLASGVAKLKDARMNAVIEASLAELSKLPPEELTLSAAAKAAGLSKFYYTRVFKARKGMSFREYLSRQRTEKAKSLMKDPALNLSGIAYSCGYKDLSSFSRAFYKATGSYPGVYRSINYN